MELYSILLIREWNLVLLVRFISKQQVQLWRGKAVDSNMSSARTTAAFRVVNVSSKSAAVKSSYLTVLSSSSFTDQNLRKLAQISSSGQLSDVAVLNADSNNFSTLMGVECYPALIQVSQAMTGLLLFLMCHLLLQLSACNNSLVRMEGVQFVLNLVTLNLQNNSITEISGLEGLVHLQWLSLAGNSITVSRDVWSGFIVTSLYLP